jgi:hypothetical protein
MSASSEGGAARERDMRVCETMTRDVQVAHADDTIAKAAELMAAHARLRQDVESAPRAHDQIVNLFILASELAQGLADAGVEDLAPLKRTWRR